MQKIRFCLTLSLLIICFPAFAVNSTQSSIKDQTIALRSLLEMYTYNTATPKGDQFPRILGEDAHGDGDITKLLKKNFEAILADRKLVLNNMLNYSDDGFKRSELMALEKISVIEKTGKNDKKKKKIMTSEKDGSEIKVLIKAKTIVIHFLDLPAADCEGVDFAVCGTEEEEDDDESNTSDSASPDKTTE